MPKKSILNEFRYQAGFRQATALSIAILLLPGYVCFSDAVLVARANSSKSNLNPEKSSPSIPPEVLRQLQKLPDQPQAVVVAIPRLGTTGRLLLLLLAVIVIFASIIICRFINSQNYFDSQNSVFLLLGLFGAIAALVIATACVGSLYLHLAAAVCTIISGFCLMAFLFPQFDLTRQWVTGTPELSDADIQNSKVKNLPEEPESEGEPI